MNKRGSVTVLVGWMVPVALLSGLFAVDAARVWLARTRLQAALDAAVLTGARDMGTTASEKAARNVAIRAVLAGNNGNNGAPPVPGGRASPWTDIRITEPSRTQIQVEASVRVESLLSGLLGFGDMTKTITRKAIADRSTTGVELALVVDVTLSMMESSGSTTRIAAAHEAAHTLLQALYVDDPTRPAEKKKWLDNVYISVVPFNVAVNYGSANAHFMASSSAPNYRQSWSGPTSWGGCALMRDPSLLDARATTSSNGLMHYFWPSTYDTTKKYVQSPTSSNPSSCASGAAYKDTRTNNPSGAHNVCMGHNDWTAPPYVLTGETKNNKTEGAKQNTLISAFEAENLVRSAGLDVWAAAHGPNMMCPPATHAVLPLTRDRTVVEQRIDALRQPPFSWGTNVAAGLQAGWFTLSPNWRKESGYDGWPSAEPPADSSDPRPPLPALPLNYNTERMNKVMVVLTDGDNLWLNASNVQESNLVRPESVQRQGFYGSYGYLQSEFSGDISTTTTSDGSLKIDDEAERWCANIKARHGTSTEDKITIYTIAFGSSIGDRARTTLQTCASTKDGEKLYYLAPTAERLKEIFKNIGNELVRLRLSQ